MELKPCPKCGRAVELKYKAGIAPSLAKICGMTEVSVKGYPHYYIQCGCGVYEEVQITTSSAEQRDRQKNKFIRAWNRRAKEAEHEQD